jgi:hypothetical protein
MNESICMSAWAILIGDIEPDGEIQNGLGPDVIAD